MGILRNTFLFVFIVFQDFQDLKRKRKIIFSSFGRGYLGVDYFTVNLKVGNHWSSLKDFHCVCSFLCRSSLLTFFGKVLLSNDHAKPFFVKAKILPVQFLYYESVCNLMFDINENTASRNILNLFSRISSVHSYKTRSSTSDHFDRKESRINAT